ncbi:Putative restriction endonuclease [Bryocella elongata]|uniref:Putative restriction endonuclease n=1 Tax=Bryocella elongata TaxID=863522 RepID=A0A1H5X2C6_9BACT|nr:Uma2 family endonuclease [Bryocella elongata]SEG05931.1 Putative restriction endonuclease [Bryocella elongata]
MSAIPSGAVQSAPTTARRALPASVRGGDIGTAREPRERAVGEMHHASVLKFLTIHLGQHEREWQIRVLPRQNVQVSPHATRVADLAVARRETRYESPLATPPLLVVEILCDEDRMSGSRELIEDYVAMGVETVWVLDPKRRRAYAAEKGGVLTEERHVLTVEGTPIHVPVRELFSELDEMEFVVE